MRGPGKEFFWTGYARPGRTEPRRNITRLPPRPEQNLHRASARSAETWPNPPYLAVRSFGYSEIA